MHRDTYCLLSKDQAFLRHCSATEAPDKEWKQHASPPIHHHDTKEHLEGWKSVALTKFKRCKRLLFNNMTKRWQSSPVCSYLAQEISTVGSSSTPNTPPSQERKRPNNAALTTETRITVSPRFHSLCFIYNDNKAELFPLYKPHYAVVDSSNLPWHFVVT